MAAGHTYQLTITSVAAPLFTGQVRSATLPGASGELTVLAGHEPFVTTLKQGIISVEDEGGAALTFEIANNGVLEVSGAQATVLL